MRFLVTTSVKKHLPVPPDAVPALLSAQLEWIHEHASDGTIETIYGFAHGGGVAIVHAEDGEGLSSLLMSTPAFALLDWETRPLVEIDASLTNAIEMFEKVAGRMATYR